MPFIEDKTLALPSSPDFDPEQRLYYYEAVVVKHIDGDTIGAHIDKGFGELWRYSKRKTKYIPVRFARINAWEPNRRYGQSEEQKQLGIAASEFVEKELPIGSRLILQTYTADDFTRLMAEVFFQYPGKGWLRWSDYMVEKGHARHGRYD